MTIQELATAAWPYIVVLAAIGLLIWFAVSLSRWYGASKAVPEPETPPAMDLGPLVNVKQPDPRPPTPADRAKANVAAKAKLDSEADQLRKQVADELATAQAAQTELESILATKQEPST